MIKTLPNIVQGQALNFLGRDGEYLGFLPRRSSLNSLRVNTEKFFSLKDIEQIVFVGSSASGKSTIERAIREASLNDPSLRGKIDVPRRVVTRNPRADDDKCLVYCSREEFAQMIENNQLGLHGEKIMEKGRLETYGLTRPKSGLPIYFANNGVVKNPDSVRPKSLMQTALIVALYSPDHIRKKRLLKRNPEMFIQKPIEAAFRLSKDESSTRIAIHAHIIALNFGRYENQVIDDIKKLIHLVLEVKRNRGLPS